jgi:hypothetical protein
MCGYLDFERAQFSGVLTRFFIDFYCQGVWSDAIKECKALRRNAVNFYVVSAMPVFSEEPYIPYKVRFNERHLIKFKMDGDF